MLVEHAADAVGLAQVERRGQLGGAQGAVHGERVGEVGEVERGGGELAVVGAVQVGGVVLAEVGDADDGRGGAGRGVGGRRGEAGERGGEQGQRAGDGGRCGPAPTGGGASEVAVETVTAGGAARAGEGEAMRAPRGVGAV